MHWPEAAKMNSLRIEARAQVSSAWLVAAPFVAVAVTLLAAAALLLISGAPVGRAFAAIAQGSFGSTFAVSETLTRATPLILTGLAATIAFRAKLYNIGAEGQLYLGALAAAGIGGSAAAQSASWPLPVLFAAMCVVGMLAGALLLAISAALKLRFGVDEVVTTLLMNFVALLLVSLLLDGPMKDPTAMGWPQSVAVVPELEFTRLMDKSRVHSGLMIAGAAALAMAALLRFTRFGFAVRAVGANAQAARFLGLPGARTVMLVALISGALAGFAGVSEVAGRTGYVTLDMSPGYGYSGIVIAMLAQLQPLAVIFAAVFVAAVLVGADSMSRVLAVPTYIADVLVAVALLSMLVAAMAAHYRLRAGQG